MKQQLIDEVINRIEEDIKSGDKTAIDELLQFVDAQYLVAYLPETQWDKYKNFAEVERIENSLGQYLSSEVTTETIIKLKQDLKNNPTDLIDNLDYLDVYEPYEFSLSVELLCKKIGLTTETII